MEMVSWSKREAWEAIEYLLVGRRLWRLWRLNCRWLWTSRDWETTVLIPRRCRLFVRLIAGARGTAAAPESSPEWIPECGLRKPTSVSLFRAISLSLKSRRLLSWFFSFRRSSICRTSCSRSSNCWSSSFSFWSVSKYLSSFSKIMRWHCFSSWAICSALIFGLAPIYGLSWCSLEALVPARKLPAPLALNAAPISLMFISRSVLKFCLFLEPTMSTPYSIYSSISYFSSNFLTLNISFIFLVLSYWSTSYWCFSLIFFALSLCFLSCFLTPIFKFCISSFRPLMSSLLSFYCWLESSTASWDPCIFFNCILSSRSCWSLLYYSLAWFSESTIRLKFSSFSRSSCIALILRFVSFICFK